VRSGSEDAVVADEVGARRRDQCGEAAQELGGLQQQCLAAVAERPLETVGESAVRQFGEALLRERRAGAVAAEMREPFTVVRVQVHCRVQ
jgi:hypothetical protein